MKMIFVLFTTLFLFVPKCFAIYFGAPVSVTVTGTSTMEMAANGIRQYLIIQNTGSVPVIVKFGSIQTAGEGVVIPAGGAYEPVEAPASSVWMETATGSATVTLIQGQ